jgi:DNA-binding transcriptional regulator YdaS (Cro superfamily)
VDLKTYLTKLDVAKRDELATACGTTLGHLQNIYYGLRTCAPGLATAIEQATEGAVTRRDLRPDDWHLIWPELAKGKPTAKQAA